MSSHDLIFMGLKSGWSRNDTDGADGRIVARRIVQIYVFGLFNALDLDNLKERT